eukprot:1834209-Prymnesium_polylepis.1
MLCGGGAPTGSALGSAGRRLQGIGGAGQRLSGAGGSFGRLRTGSRSDSCLPHAGTASQHHQHRGGGELVSVSSVAGGAWGPGEVACATWRRAATGPITRARGPAVVPRTSLLLLDRALRECGVGRESQRTERSCSRLLVHVAWDTVGAAWIVSRRGDVA